MREPLRVLLLTPTALPRMTGNAITAERWRRLLTERGLLVRVLSTEALCSRDLIKMVDDFLPDIIHGHHATKSGRFLLDPLIARRCAGLPFVVSPAGTDVNGQEGGQGRPEQVLQVLRRAQVIITQNSWLVPWLRQHAATLCRRVLYVAKSVVFMGDTPFDLRKACGWQPDETVFFFPSGIRPVKNNLACLQALESVFKDRRRLRAVFAGPVLDDAYGSRFLAEIRRLSGFVRWLPSIPPESMAAAYASADVVLNASSSEGLANVILEGMTVGRPVLASDIAGNRLPLAGEPGGEPCGILFNPGDPGDFHRQALTLMDDGKLQAALGMAGQARMAAFFHPEAEADGLLKAYTLAAERHQDGGGYTAAP